MGLFDHLFKSKSPPAEDQTDETGLRTDETVKRSDTAGRVGPTHKADPSAFLHPKSFVPRGVSPLAPPAKSVANTGVRKPGAPTTPPPPEEIVLTLGDVLSRIPTPYLKAGAHDPKRELRFSVNDLSSDIARGRAAVPLSRIAQLIPDIFTKEISKDEDTEIRLPLQKLVEQIGLLRARPQGGVADRAPRPVGPAFAEAANLPPSPPDILALAAPVSPETIQPLGEAPPILRFEPEPGVELKPAVTSIQPVIVNAEPLIELKPASDEPATLPVAGAEAPAPETLPSLPPDTTPAAQVEPEPAPKPEPTPVDAVPAPVETIQTSTEVKAEEPPPIPVGNAEPLSRIIPFEIPASPTPDPIPVPAPEPAAEAVPALDFDAPPVEVEEPAELGGERIQLSLAALLRQCPKEIIIGDMPMVPDSVRITLPFAPIDRQLVKGHVEISAVRFVAALPIYYQKYFFARMGVKIPIPLEEVFQNLPNQSPDPALKAGPSAPVLAPADPGVRLTPPMETAVVLPSAPSLPQIPEEPVAPAAELPPVEPEPIEPPVIPVPLDLPAFQQFAPPPPVVAPDPETPPMPPSEAAEDKRIDLASALTSIPPAPFQTEKPAGLTAAPVVIPVAGVGEEKPDDMGAAPVALPVSPVGEEKPDGLAAAPVVMPGTSVGDQKPDSLTAVAAAVPASPVTDEKPGGLTAAPVAVSASPVGGEKPDGLTATPVAIPAATFGEEKPGGLTVAPAAIPSAEVGGEKPADFGAPLTYVPLAEAPASNGPAPESPLVSSLEDDVVVDAKKTEVVAAPESKEAPVEQSEPKPEPPAAPTSDALSAAPTVTIQPPPMIRPFIVLPPPIFAFKPSTEEAESSSVSNLQGPEKEGSTNDITPGGGTGFISPPPENTGLKVFETTVNNGLTEPTEAPVNPPIEPVLEAAAPTEPEPIDPVERPRVISIDFSRALVSEEEDAAADQAAAAAVAGEPIESVAPSKEASEKPFELPPPPPSFIDMVLADDRVEDAPPVVAEVTPAPLEVLAEQDATLPSAVEPIPLEPTPASPAQTDLPAAVFPAAATMRTINVVAEFVPSGPSFPVIPALVPAPEVPSEGAPKAAEPPSAPEEVLPAATQESVPSAEAAPVADDLPAESAPEVPISIAPLLSIPKFGEVTESEVLPPPGLPLRRFDQDALQALFMTEEALDLQKISRLAAQLPGVHACVIATRDQACTGGTLPEGFDLAALLGLAPRVGEAAGRLPIGELKHFTLYGERYSVSFFERNGLSLCAVHRPRSFVPGVREKLVAIADELSKS